MPAGRSGTGDGDPPEVVADVDVVGAAGSQPASEVSTTASSSGIDARRMTSQPRRGTAKLRNPPDPPADRAVGRGRYDAGMSDARPVAASRVTLTQLMEVTDANVMGNVHGGVLMRLADTAAGLAAFRHAQGPCVTVSVDEMAFLHPVHVGDLVTVQASVNDVGTTSLECGVRIETEDVACSAIASTRRARTSCSSPWTRRGVRGRFPPSSARPTTSAGVSTKQSCVGRPG